MGAEQMEKILIITSSYDYTVDYIINKYKDIAEFFRFNVDMLDKYTFELTENKNWEITSKAWAINIQDVYSIYYRKPMLPDLSMYQDKYLTMISKDIIAIVNGIVDSFDGKVLTKPFKLRKVENKVFQLKIANEIGFLMPSTLITNDNLSVTDFIKKKSIIKPLTTGKVLEKGSCEIYQTNIIEKIEDDISLTPAYLQGYVEKEYEVRVTIVGEKVFPVRIDFHNRIDWRKDEEKNKYSIIQLPSFIEDKCKQLLKFMDIKFGAIDFIVDKEGNWIFLEINPNGQWLWLEESLKLDISEEIFLYLSQ